MLWGNIMNVPNEQNIWHNKKGTEQKYYMGTKTNVANKTLFNVLYK